MVAIPCICPPDGSRHPDGDEVTLRPKLDYRHVAAIENSVAMLRIERGNDDMVDIDEVMGLFDEGYLRYGVVAWTLEGPDGPIPATPKNVERYLLPNITACMLVGQEAQEAYQGDLLVPLAVRASRSSADTPTTDSTSPPTGSSEEETDPPTPLKPSSITTIQTDDTATTGTSPDGDSRSSPRWVSAG